MICVVHQLRRHQPIASLVVDISIGAEALAFNSWAGQIGHCHQRLAFFAKFLYCPGVKQRRWTPPLVTRFGVILRVSWRFDQSELMRWTLWFLEASRRLSDIFHSRLAHARRSWCLSTIRWQPCYWYWILRRTSELIVASVSLFY